MTMLGKKSAAAAVAATENDASEFKFTRSVVFATELHPQYRLASG